MWLASSLLRWEGETLTESLLWPELWLRRLRTNPGIESGAAGRAGGGANPVRFEEGVPAFENCLRIQCNLRFVGAGEGLGQFFYMVACGSRRMCVCSLYKKADSGFKPNLSTLNLYS